MFGHVACRNDYKVFYIVFDVARFLRVGHDSRYLHVAALDLFKSLKQILVAAGLHFDEWG